MIFLSPALLLKNLMENLLLKGTYSKTARGEMVRFMAENNIQNYEDLKKFNYFGYVFREDLFFRERICFERVE